MIESAGDITLYYPKQSLTGLLLSLTVLFGCQKSSSDLPNLAHVRGVVKMNNAPLSEATVTFFPENGRPSSAVTDSEGSYTLSYTESISGAMVGPHTVVITTAPPDDPASERIPAQFNSKTTLKAEIQPGQNELNFELVSN